MLDIRAVAYVSPVSEVPFESVPLTVRLANVADETGLVTGHFRIYNTTTGTLIHTSEIIPFSLSAGQSFDASALTDFDPPAPLDDTYFVVFDGRATNSLVPDGIGIFLGSFHFDVKPVGMGPAPAAHHATHENGGSDPIDVTGLLGELTDPQPPKDHASEHATGGGDEINVTGLSGELADDQPAIAHDIAGARHTSTATPGQVLQADANGLPVDATNTDAEVDAAVGASHARQHDILATDDHTTTEMDDTLVLAPDGAGGVEFRAEAGGGGSGLSETPQVLTDQAAIDWDLSLGGAATVTLGGDRTLNEATNMVNGSHASLRIIQDGTGTRLLTWHATYRFPGGVDPALSAAIGNEDILLFSCDGTHMDCVSMVSAVA